MKKILIVLLAFMSLTASVVAINYTGYIEPFNNSSRIQTLDDLILNTTRGSITFNDSASGSGLMSENTTEYTSNAPALIFRFDSETRIQGYQVPKDQSYYVYKDYGADYLADFKAQCDIRFLNYQSNGLGSAIKFSTNLASDEGHQGGSDQALMVRVYHHWDSNYDYSIGLTVSNDGSYTTDWYYSGINTPFWRYVDLYREGPNAWLEIYSDVARTSLVDNLTVTVNSDSTYRYAYWGSTYNNGQASRLLYWYCDNFKFRPSGVTEGYFYSKDLLNGISANASALLYETSIDGSNSIILEVSEDNTTWVRSETVNNGYGALSLDDLGYSTLYTRGNFSRPGSSGYCDLEELTVIYEGGSGATPSASYGVAIVLLILGLIIGTGIKRE